MLSAGGAQPPLAHVRSTISGEGGLQEELHAHYSMIAMLVLATLFFTVTVSATGLLLAFCKKNNAVFTLQKSEQDSHLEMDDLEKTDTESCHDDAAGSTQQQTEESTSVARQQRRSVTFPELSGLISCEESVFSEPSHYSSSCNRQQTHKAQASRATASHYHQIANMGGSPVRRSLTVAAIHHTDHPPNRAGNIIIRVEDFDSNSELSDSALGPLYFQLQEEKDMEVEEKSPDGETENSDSDADTNNDQTTALLTS